MAVFLSSGKQGTWPPVSVACYVLSLICCWQNLHVVFLLWQCWCAAHDASVMVWLIQSLSFDTLQRSMTKLWLVSNHAHVVAIAYIDTLHYSNAAEKCVRISYSHWVTERFSMMQVCINGWSLLEFVFDFLMTDSSWHHGKRPTGTWHTCHTTGTSVCLSRWHPDSGNTEDVCTQQEYYSGPVFGKFQLKTDLLQLPVSKNWILTGEVNLLCSVTNEYVTHCNLLQPISLTW